MAVHQVQLIAQGADAEPACTAPLTWRADWTAAATCIRRIGRGATFCVPTDNLSQFSQAVVAALQRPEQLVPNAAPFTRRFQTSRASSSPS